MVKYKYTLTWLILFSIAIVTAAILMGPEGEPDIYNPGVIVGAVLIFFCCPAVIFDRKNTEKYKLKQEQEKLKYQLQLKGIETAIKQQDLALEQQKTAIEYEKKRLGEKSHDIYKFCINCGKKNQQDASICPYCGSELKKEQKQIIQIQTPEYFPPPIVLPQTPKTSIWKQLATWILSEIAYCIMFSVMMAFMIVMMLLFL